MQFFLWLRIDSQSAPASARSGCAQTTHASSSSSAVIALWPPHPGECGGDCSEAVDRKEKRTASTHTRYKGHQVLAPVRAVCDGVAGSVQVFLTAMVMPAAARGTMRFRALFSATYLYPRFFGDVSSEILNIATLHTTRTPRFSLVSVKNHRNKKKRKAIRS